MKRKTTTRHLPIGKERDLRRLVDASVHCTPLFEHSRREFGNAASARMFDDKEDSDVCSVDSSSEFFHTLVAAEPSSKNIRAGFR